MTDQIHLGIKLTVALNRAARIVAGIADPRERVTVTLTQEHITALSPGARTVLADVLDGDTYQCWASTGTGQCLRPLPLITDDTAQAVCVALEAAAVDVRDRQTAYDDRMTQEDDRRAEQDAKIERHRAGQERQARDIVTSLDPATMTESAVSSILCCSPPHVPTPTGGTVAVPDDLHDHVRSLAERAKTRHLAQAAQAALDKAARTQAAYDMIDLSDEAQLVLDGGLDAGAAVHGAMTSAGLRLLRDLGLKVEEHENDHGLHGVRARDLPIDESLRLLGAAQTLGLEDEAWPTDVHGQLMARDATLGKIAVQLDVWRAGDIRDEDESIADEDLPATEIVITVRVRHVDLECGWSDFLRVL